MTFSIVFFTQIVDGSGHLLCFIVFLLKQTGYCSLILKCPFFNMQPDHKRAKYILLYVASCDITFFFYCHTMLYCVT